MLMSEFTPPSSRPAWQALEQLARNGVPHLRDLLQDPQREQSMQAGAAGITLDYSRQRITAEVMEQLQALALSVGLMEQAHAMFRGEPINITEKRPVLHVALRGSEIADPPWGQAISTQVADELDRLCRFAEHARSGGWTGYQDTSITDVVNLGIGGSDLGPRMCSQALGHLTPESFKRPLRVHFVSNVDPWSLFSTLAPLDPSRTAFIVQSKSFTTTETLALTAAARRWLQDGGCPESQQPKHWVAVTAQPSLAAQCGVKPEHIFRFWDWVGGRYSIWSAIGLPLVLSVGADGFRSMLRGAREMDAHFLSAPAAHNLPLLLALLGVWNINFLGASTHLVTPYVAPLGILPAFLQQLEMESNGKRTHVDGTPTHIATAPVVWGGLGIDGQHAYFQLLHQGCHLIPVDFIGQRTHLSNLPLAHEHHRLVLISMKAQAQALALGRSWEDTCRVLQVSGLDKHDVSRLAPHRTYPGNTPSSTLWLESLTPHSLGALIALYEHKVFCQAAIWGICAFDQWGVELGKTLAQAQQP